MKSTTHFAMAHFLCASLKARGIELSRVAFVYGNIAPDYVPALYVRPHFTWTCNHMISKFVKLLSETRVSEKGVIGPEYSMRLGLMCHFICDYFCFAHNPDFSGSLPQHITYERDLDEYLRQNCTKLLDLNGAEPLEPIPGEHMMLLRIANSKRNYQHEGYTMENDIRFAFDACLSTIYSAVLLARKVPATAERIESIELYDKAMSLKGYATGDNLVFRLFFLKNHNVNIFYMPDLMPPLRA
ncbi:MAG: zinc dependent phospholipase C family protein [Oscillospiraceae bacterium]|jgi:hypothetical protein